MKLVGSKRLMMNCKVFGGFRNTRIGIHNGHSTGAHTSSIPPIGVIHGTYGAKKSEPGIDAFATAGVNSVSVISSEVKPSVSVAVAQSSSQKGQACSPSAAVISQAVQRSPARLNVVRTNVVRLIPMHATNIHL